MLKNLERSQTTLKLPPFLSKNLYHLKVTNQHEDYYYKLVDRFFRDYDVIVTEDLNVKGLMKNRRMARNFADASFGTLKTILKQKAFHHEKLVIEVGRFFASSKICSNCHAKNDGLTLLDRVWKCKNCEDEHDRELNAATNIEKEGCKILTKQMVQKIKQNQGLNSSTHDLEHFLTIAQNYMGQNRA